MEPAAFVIGGLVLVLVVRLLAGGLDGGRVERYVRDQGWELVDRSWDPLGPGWFGEKDSRIYQIVYRDQRGDLHRAHVKTSMMSGVYLTRDQIVERAAPAPLAPAAGDLVQENARLRERIAELEADRE
jgi:hypothetical protein